MKAFEEWDKPNKVNYAEISTGELSVKNERRKAWKAALRWVENEILECLSPQDALEVMREELEDEQ